MGDQPALDANVPPHLEVGGDGQAEVLLVVAAGRGVVHVVHDVLELARALRREGRLDLGWP